MRKVKSTNGRNGFGSSGGRSPMGSAKGDSRLPWMKALIASQKKEQLQASVNCGVKVLWAAVLELVDSDELHVHDQI